MTNVRVYVAVYTELVALVLEIMFSNKNMYLAKDMNTDVYML